MTLSQSTEELVSSVVRSCQANEHRLLLGQTPLTLTAGLLNRITEAPSTGLSQSANYLKQLIRKAPSVKLIGDPLSSDVVRLDLLESCLALELHRIQIYRLQQWDQLRQQLKTLALVKSVVGKLDHHFWETFGAWPRLNSFRLCHSSVDRFDVRWLPNAVKTLDLSWNRIQRLAADHRWPNRLERLDLSFNSMAQLPKLNPTICQSLTHLFLRSNLIESIDGVEELVGLVELDVAYNCLVDVRSFLAAVKTRASVRRLWVEGNPFCCDKNVDDLIKSQLLLTHLDGRALPVVKKNVDEEKSVDDSIEEAEEKIRSGIYHLNNNNNDKQRRTKKRVAVILDDDEDAQKQSEEEASMSTLTPSCSGFNRNPNEDSAAKTTKLIKDLRQKHGSEWLASMTGDLLSSSSSDQTTDRTNDLQPEDVPSASSSSPAITDITNLILNMSPPAAESTPKSEYFDDAYHQDVAHHHHQHSHQHDDDIEVIPKEEVQWSREELDNPSNIFLVDCLDLVVETVGQETVFIYIREDDGMVFEKDPITGKVLRSLDLSVLTAAKSLAEDTIKLIFDSQIKWKRERTYQFDSVDTSRRFHQQFIDPWLAYQAKKNQMKISHYECLKCGQRTASDSELVACGNCGSDVVMKLTQNQHRLDRGDWRRRRSGSDILVLEAHKPTMDSTDEVSVWDELSQTPAPPADFTRLHHRIKLHFEVEIFDGPDEVLVGAVKCWFAVREPFDLLDDALLLVTNKKFYVCSWVDASDKPIRMLLSKPVNHLRRVRHLPGLLRHQGLWIEWTNSDQPEPGSSLSNSFLAKTFRRQRTGTRTGQANETSSWTVVIFGDGDVGLSFIDFFQTSTLDQLKLAVDESPFRILIDDSDYIILENTILDIVVVGQVNWSAKNQQHRPAEDLQEPLALVVTKQRIHVTQLMLQPQFDCHLKVVFKELIINLSLASVNLDNNQVRLNFADDNSELSMVVALDSPSAIRRLIEPIKSRWEQSFDVPLQVTRC